MIRVGDLLGFIAVAMVPGTMLAQDATLTTVIQVESGEHTEAWALTIEADGQSVQQRGREAIAKLFRFYDLDSDGRLRKGEATTIASPAGLRQLPLGRLLPTTIMRPTDVDRNADGQVTPEEFQKFYEGLTQTGLWLACDTTPRNAEMNAALLDALQVKAGDQVDRRQFQRSMSRLVELDSNADQLISPGEILTGHVYPGITPTRMISGNVSSVHSFNSLSITRRDAAAADHHWSIDLSGTGAKLRDLTKTVQDDDPVAFRSHSAIASVRLHVAEGNDRRAREAMSDLASQFASGAGGDLQIALSEVAGMQNQVDLEKLIPLADANADEVLTADEFAKWQEVVEAYIRSVVVVTILDFEQNLFTALDTNFDGSLSLQEREDAWQTLSASDVISQERWTPERLPRQLRLVVSQGPCRQLLDQGSSQGPPWFLAMDRNRDGQISRDEFPASSEKFADMDQDGDGFLSLTDIAAAQQ